jgi:hypothetical protein
MHMLTSGLPPLTPPSKGGEQEYGSTHAWLDSITCVHTVVLRLRDRSLLPPSPYEGEGLGVRFFRPLDGGDHGKSIRGPIPSFPPLNPLA